MLLSCNHFDSSTFFVYHQLTDNITSICCVSLFLVPIESSYLFFVNRSPLRCREYEISTGLNQRRIYSPGIWWRWRGREEKKGGCVSRGTRLVTAPSPLGAMDTCYSCQSSSHTSLPTGLKGLHAMLRITKHRPLMPPKTPP